MHDPDVVAFEIRRPWPKRVNWTGTRWYWPSLITVWHREPGGHDSGEVCKHFAKIRGTERHKLIHGWRLHVHHWRIRVHPLQELRRRLLTRCAWCGGKHSKADPVNNSHQWDREPGRWWRGETGLYHRDCSSIGTAHRACLCEDPLTTSSSFGGCLLCGKHRSYGVTVGQLARQRILATIPAGRRDPAKYQQICDMYAAEAAETGPQHTQERS